MAIRFETLETQAVDQSLEDRLKLADWMIAGVFHDNDIEEAWASQVERRVAEIDAGRVRMVPGTEVITRARDAIKPR